jgi:flagellar FliL protein
MAKAPAKPAAKPAAPAAKAGDAAEAPKSKKKLIIIAAVVVALAAGGGVFFMKSKKGEHAEEAKVEVHAEPKFIPLETFTVNLQREEAGDQFLQVNITLKVMDPLLEEKVKAVLPEIRSKLNLLLSSKRPSELSSVPGKKRLAAEIAFEANNVLGFHNAPPAPVAGAAPAAEHEHAPEAAAPEGAAPAAEQHAAPAAEGAAPSEAGAAAEAPAHEAHAEPKGIVDVLFTSFIIQ